MNTKRLLEQLASPDELQRQIAQEELGAIMDDSVAQAILDVAEKGESDEIRGDAIIALGPVVEECGIEYDEGFAGDALEEEGSPVVSRETFRTLVSRVRAMYDDESQPKLVRRRAFEVLIRDPQPWMPAEIRRHYTSFDSDWRRTAMFAMGMVSGFEKEVASAVAKADGPLLYEAVRAAGRMELTQTAARIRALAASDETDRDLRVIAILALPNVDRKATELLESLSNSDDEEISETAEEALDELSFRQQLFDKLDGDGDDE